MRSAHEVLDKLRSFRDDKVNGLMLSNNVIGLITGNGEFIVKKGQVNAAWVDEYGPNLHAPAAVGAAVYSDPADSGNDRAESNWRSSAGMSCTAPTRKAAARTKASARLRRKPYPIRSAPAWRIID